ncbi:hypothetical protein [Nocardioides ginkgobilobae]
MATDSDRQYSMKGTMDHRSTTRVVHSRAPRILLGLLVMLSIVLGGPSASARKDDVTKRTFDCKATSSVKLKAEPENNGLIKVTAVVFSEDDDKWDWKMKHNDDTSAKGSVQAKDADRSFRIIRDMADFTGTDYIDFRAENTATGEVCRASIQH